MAANDKYNEMLSFLRAEIQGLRKGLRLPSYRALMKQFSCSQSTVDRVMDVLRAEVSEKLQEADLLGDVVDTVD